MSDFATKGERDAFFAGVCCTLSTIGYIAHGTVQYDEVVEQSGGRELLNYARRQQDIELPEIRKAIRRMERVR